MASFKFGCVVTVSAFTVVEADTLEEAEEIAKARDAAIGGNGSGIDETEYFIIEDCDGSPREITYEEE